MTGWLLVIFNTEPITTLCMKYELCLASYQFAVNCGDQWVAQRENHGTNNACRRC